MPIKFNKIVKPVVPLSEGNLTPISQGNPASAPQQDNKTVESTAAKPSTSIMEGLPAMPQQATQEAVADEQVQEITAPDPVTEALTKPGGRPMGNSMEDTLRKFLGKQIRVYTADHEYVAGKLEIVDDGWIKICNARSAGSDYYFDEDIVNTANIVRVRASIIIDKKQYVDFMNSDK